MENPALAFGQRRSDGVLFGLIERTAAEPGEAPLVLNGATGDEEEGVEGSVSVEGEVDRGDGVHAVHGGLDGVEISGDDSARGVKLALNVLGDAEAGGDGALGGGEEEPPGGAGVGGAEGVG